ncbi:MAG: penicillin-binding protein 1A [Gammaproteobacteria bacterium]|nr:penicillin-binding protein 1A [Gammaproteobacteria bacterium]
MLRFLFSLVLSVFVVGAITLAGLSLHIIPQLPDIETLRDVHMQVPLRVYTRDLSLISEFGEKRRKPLKIAEVPRKMVDAFIAAEDDRFFAHPGVDWQGILRAALNLARTGEKTQGGSTITMQVARNFFLSREKSYLRKLNEIFLALKIERELSKDEILELYLNKIYLGQRAYGVGAAAQVYYGSELGDLDLAQIAMLAGLPKAPSTTNPVSSPQRALQRREYVLRRMLELEMIGKDEYDAASIEPLSASLHSPNIEVEAPYVAEMVRQQLVDQYGEDAYSAGYRVITTINDRYQAAANHALRVALLDYDQRHGYRGPERHLEFAEGAVDDGTFERFLRGTAIIGDLYPALITDVQSQSATAWLSGVGLVALEWPGIEWARKYISENARGPGPKIAGDVVRRGDVVRIIEDEEGRWRLSQLPAVEGALVSLRPDDGAIFALVGGFDFGLSSFNRAVQAQRQPGSSFKPFIYSAALDAGFTAASIINDAPVVFEDPGVEEMWRPENYSGRYYGPTRLREALTHSRNLVSIRLLHAIGVPRALEQAARFGFDPHTLPKNLSLALGSGTVSPLQMARAYGVFANGGFLTEPYLIERVETDTGEIKSVSSPSTVCRECESAFPAESASGEAEQGLASAQAAEPAAAPESEPPVPPATAAGPARRIAPRVVNAQNIWIMDSMTRDVIRFGTGRRALELNRSDLSGKTGTTNDQRDAWFAGFNPGIVTVTWVGFDNFEPLGNLETGGRAALPMWIEYMRIALQDIPEMTLERPDGIVNVRIDPHTGSLAKAGDPDAIFEVFQSGTAPSTEEGAGGPSAALEQGEDLRRGTEDLF